MGRALKTGIFNVTFTIILGGLLITAGSCGQTVGFGTEIDFEPPVLTLDPGPNPRYVTNGATLSGTVTDNVKVERVELSYVDSITGEPGSLQATISGNIWTAVFNFDESHNGRKLITTITAYDKAGNSGESAIKTINLYVDLHEPDFSRVEIARSNIKTAELESLAALKALETSDPDANTEAYVNRYQNGDFWIRAQVSEEETSVDEVYLNIYDAYDDEQGNEVIGRREIDPGSTVFSPKWTITESDLLDAPGRGYRARAGNGERLYFRVSLEAVDRSENTGHSEKHITDYDYFCYLPEADNSRSALGSGITQYVSKGAIIPVFFYDDDIMVKAWVTLISAGQDELGNPKGQWNDQSYTGAAADAADAEKLLSIKEKLENGGTLYDWHYDKYNDDSERDTANPSWRDDWRIKPGITSLNAIDNSSVAIQTGNTEADYGQFKLVILIEDQKSAPHPENTPNNWTLKAYDIYVTDENVPLIVFNTAEYDSVNNPDGPGGSPEENTFPKLTEEGDGKGPKYFLINGFTYDENSQGTGGVDTFRMAWIPYNMPGGPDGYVSSVRNALAAEGGPTAGSYPYPSGVQHWNLTNQVLGDTTPDEGIGNPPMPYRKQIFQKRFNVLGDETDPETGWKDFHYEFDKGDGKGNIYQLENEAKLFVFYTKDKQNHGVFRTLRLLGNKKPPALTVRDATLKSIDLSGIPRRENYSTQAAYNTALQAYQKSAYDGIHAQGSDAPVAGAYETYPRDTPLKYYVNAEETGDLAIAEISMRDITYSANPDDAPPIGHYEPDGRVLTYCEALPEVEQRSFLFTAIDTLGNEVRIQRTIAVTTKAVLTEITSTNTNGDYPAGEKILIRGLFSAPVHVIPGPSGAVPRLNLLYRPNTGQSFIPVPDSYIKFTGDTDTDENDISGATLYLDFEFTVPDGAGGSGIRDRDILKSADIPIDLNGAQILDVEKKDPAFLPGISPTPAWEDGNHSLQGTTLGVSDGKYIGLDGVKPRVSKALGINVNPQDKAAYSPGLYYFTAGETISITLTSNEDLIVSGTPAIRFTLGDSTDLYSAEYYGPSGSDGAVFRYTVQNNSYENSLLKIKTLYFTGEDKITDAAGNPLDADHFTDNLATLYTAKIVVDTVIGTPVLQLDGAAVKPQYNTNPVISVTGDSDDSQGSPVVKQYSLNAGLSWTEFYPVPTAWTNASGEGTYIDGSNNLRIDNGTWRISARQIDPAGNIGVLGNTDIVINDTFPRLTSISLREPSGTYNLGTASDPTEIQLILDFADFVKVTHTTGSTDNRAYVILADPAVTDANQKVNAGRTDVVKIYADDDPSPATSKTTLSFTWKVTEEALKTPNVDYKSLSGLTVTEIRLSSGVEDLFGNPGVDSTQAAHGSTDPGENIVTMGTSPNDYTVANLNGDATIVDAIVPKLDLESTGNTTPKNAGGGASPESTVSADNKTITLAFSENVMRGSGTITVKPHGNWYIPPVFTNTEFYNIYNGVFYKSDGTVMATAEAAPHRQALTRSTNTSNPSMNSLELNARDGFSIGPYRKLTHGLVSGTGYTGAKAGTGNGPGLLTGAMVPDTGTKWVLDYQYGIAGNTGNTASDKVVDDIRSALEAARYRWQEVDAIAVGIDGSKVTITLDELPKGLEWDLYYGEGTFTDEAGNPAPALAAGGYWFRSGGVQKPVIRVNRLSYDARTGTGNYTYTQTGNEAGDLNVPTTGTTYPDGGNVTWTDGTSFTLSIASFNKVRFRVDCETPGAEVNYGKLAGATNTSSLTGSFGDTAPWNTGAGGQTTTAWNDNRANYYGNGGTYLGNSSNGQGNVSGVRSFNRDALLSDLQNITASLSTGANAYNPGAAADTDPDNQFTYSGYEARKDYVAATAKVSHGTYSGESEKAYEGVFRSVVMIKNPGTNLAQRDGMANPGMKVQGSNVQNALPTISGFPVRDNYQADHRYMKWMWRVQNNNTQAYWVSTEIMAPWFIILRGGHHMQTGEIANYISGGYGDLTFANGLN